MPAISAKSALLPPLATEARLHVVTGKGGTGKTSVAAAIALALAAGGRRTLLVEVEGRQALAQLFDRPALPYAEQRLAAAAGGGEVYGLAIDPEQAMLEYLEMFYNLKRAGRLLQRMGAVDFVTTLAPGLRDVLLSGKVKEAAVRRDPRGGPDGRAYDAVVLDAPPTGRIRAFLDVTTEVVGLTKIGPIHRQSAGVAQVLHSRMTTVHLVTLLEEMPVQETIDAAADLQAAGYHLGAVVVNRVRPAYVSSEQVSRRGGVGRADMAALRRGLGSAGLDPSMSTALGRQMVEYAARQQIQTENLQRLTAVHLPKIELPDLAPPLGPGELCELSEYFRTGKQSAAVGGGASAPRAADFEPVAATAQ